jgi:hypothetical protein
VNNIGLEVAETGYKMVTVTEQIVVAVMLLIREVPDSNFGRIILTEISE